MKFTFVDILKIAGIAVAGVAIFSALCSSITPLATAVGKLPGNGFWGQG